MPMRYPVDVDGQPGFIFSEAEMTKAAEDFRYALVLKFLRSRPSIDVIWLAVVKTWVLLEIPTISLMDAHHVFIKLNSERDFVHAWAREGRVTDGCMFRLFRWTKDFDPKKEPSSIPQWIFLPGLPLHLYRTDCLQILASRFGRVLGIDNATVNKTQASGARLCVEVDLLEEQIQGFPIIISATKKIWQEVRYEKQGSYCRRCCRQGHTKVVCRVGVKKVHRDDHVNPTQDNQVKRTEV